MILPAPFSWFSQGKTLRDRTNPTFPHFNVVFESSTQYLQVLQVFSWSEIFLFSTMELLLYPLEEHPVGWNGEIELTGVKPGAELLQIHNIHILSPHL